MWNSVAGLIPRAFVNLPREHIYARLDARANRNEKTEEVRHHSDSSTVSYTSSFFLFNPSVPLHSTHDTHPATFSLVLSRRASVAIFEGGKDFLVLGCQKKKITEENGTRHFWWASRVLKIFFGIIILYFFPPPLLLNKKKMFFFVTLDNFSISMWSKISGGISWHCVLKFFLY